VIPVIETRAGIGYAHQLKNGWSIGARAGYEWQNWFNMVTALRFMDDVDSQIMGTDTTDIGLDGFFIEGFINF
jgi:major outer membrane protein